jgi:hypothetical protein
MIRSVCIIYPLIFFSLAMLVHIGVWRLLRPRRHMAFLFLVFLALPLMASTLIYLARASLPGLTLTFQEFLFSWLLYLGLAGMYIQTYPAIQASSPSLSLAYLIGRSPEGLSIQKIESLFGGGNAVRERIADLEGEGLIRKDDKTGALVLTRGGLFLASLFLWYRTFMGLEEGRG